MKCRVLLVTGVEITLISLFIIYFTRRFLSRPIDKLIEGTKAVSQMELDKPLDIVGSSEELDELARSFDVMRDRLRPRSARSTSSPRTSRPRSKSERSNSRPRSRSCSRATAWRRWAALRQRRARNQQSGLRRPEPLHAAAAHAEGRRRPAESYSRSSASTSAR